MKTALVTGANKGIGFETAKILAQKGFFVYLGSRTLEKGHEAVASLKAEGLDNVAAIKLDVTDQTSVNAARQQINTLDVLVNNAGISGPFEQSR